MRITRGIGPRISPGIAPGGYAAPGAVNRPLRDCRCSIRTAAVGSLDCALTRLGQDEREQPRALLAAPGCCTPLPCVRELRRKRLLCAMLPATPKEPACPINLPLSMN